jgi:hypothetical protein
MDGEHMIGTRSLEVGHGSYVTATKIFPSTTFTGYEATPNPGELVKEPVVTSYRHPCERHVTTLPSIFPCANDEPWWAHVSAIA